MKILNWNMFETAFDGRQEQAFEKLSYGLFCSKFNIKYGLFAYKNQIGIETDPVKIEDKQIGFQAKYTSASVPLSSKKREIISSIRKAKQRNKNLSEVYIYLNKAPGESRKSSKRLPDYLLDIEKEGDKIGVEITWQLPSHIEKQLSMEINSSIAQEYFPDLHALLRQQTLLHDKSSLLDTMKTAIIQLEIEKIKEFYYDGNWDVKLLEMRKLNRFINHSNETIAKTTFDFLESASHQTRIRMPEKNVSEIYSSILGFFPSSYNTEKIERIENGKQCVRIGFGITYDSFIHIRDLKIAQYGLTIMKYLYRYGKRNNESEISEYVLFQYEELERNLDRPERSDLALAKLLLKTYKDDLDSYDLSFPPLPKELREYISLQENREK